MKALLSKTKYYFRKTIPQYKHYLPLNNIIVSSEYDMKNSTTKVVFKQLDYNYSSGTNSSRINNVSRMCLKK